MSNTVVIITLSLLVLLSPFLSRVSRIPVVVVEIMMGSFAAYFGFLVENELFKIIAEVGFLYLMFLAGMEVDLKGFQFEKKSLIRRTILFFLMVYGFSFALVAYFHLSEVYMVSFPIFSLGMLMALIKEYGRNEPWLALALNIGIAGELISILAMTVLNGGLTYGFNIDFFFTLLVLVGFLIGFVLFFRGIRILFWWYPGLKTLIMPMEDSKDQDVRFSMALLFILIGVMLHFKIDAILGAFLAGMLITTYFKHKIELPEKLSSFGFGFLVPIFFIHVGSTLSLDAFSDPLILELALVIAIGIVSIRLIAGISAFTGYFGFKNALLFSLSNSMPLTFLVAIATLGYHAQAISHDEYYAFIMASMGSAIFLMIAIKILYSFFNRNMGGK
ncbi:MAG: cation:proton antiporter [Sulfuricurvum sp.]|uniref:cation:proton antiporter n=1 Tax=Sulfuricurvum sp. TaxID=2025608 RepID=UPI00262739AA|nr:cation:proton antiporter [Sulfuricurvum sp.]MDD2951322.1 cation:proton antiporter [Sulfuricurvum sp.]MDD5117351.1 cation:proton antiporter [Sulfuricurvum sp.]